VGTRSRPRPRFGTSHTKGPRLPLLKHAANQAKDLANFGDQAGAMAALRVTGAALGLGKAS
jgi:hypothetical protein